MKNIFLLIVSFISTSFFGQEICNEMIVSNDDVTQNTTVTSTPLHFDDFSVVITAGNKKGFFPKVLFKLKDDCIDQYQPIYLLFINGKNIKAGNFVYKYNCDGSSGFIINNGANEKLLRNELVKTIRVDARNKYYQIDLTTEQSEKLRSIIECAFNRKSWENQIKYK